MYMEEIANYNCDGLCIEITCDVKYTHHTIKKINGMNITLGFCKKHSEEFENGKDN